jgi:hypothetical protein
MKTHRYLSLLLTFTFFLTQIAAQQVYDAHHYGMPGDAQVYNRFAPGQFNDILTEEGAGITWDLSSQAGLNLHINQVLEPSEAMNQFNFLAICSFGGFSPGDCFEIWDNTEQVTQLADTLLLLDFILHSLQRFQSRNENLLLENFIGFTVELAGTPTQAVIVYQNQDTITQFPVSYGNSWTSSTRYGLDLNPAGQNILYYSKQTRNTTIDAWGTLQTPFDTFENVIRLRSDILRVDTIIENDTDTTFLVADQIEYMWLDTNFALPIMTANGLINENDSIILNAVEYVFQESCPEPTWEVDPGGILFYTDTAGNATVHFVINNSNADTYSWNFGDGQFEETTGDVSHTYNAPGVYTVSIAGCMANCLPLNSCSTQFITFEVLDTTTSIVHIEGDKVGIKLFPNPVSQSLNLFIPATLGEQQFSIFDLNGKTVYSGTIPYGNVSMDTDRCANGLYTIQFRSGQQVAYMRFQVIRD